MTVQLTDEELAWVKRVVIDGRGGIGALSMPFEMIDALVDKGMLSPRPVFLATDAAKKLVTGE